MLIIDLTPQERQIIERLLAATGPAFQAEVCVAYGGVGFTANDRDELVAALAVMPTLGHDAGTVSSLIHRVITTEKAPFTS